MADNEPVRLRFDAFDLDEGNARLTRNGQPLTLPPKAFAVLCELARRPGQLVTKATLLDSVWGHQHVSESVLKTIVGQIRAALSDDAKQPRYVETASRFGYRFIANVGVAVEKPRPATQPSLTVDAPQLIGRKRVLTKLHGAWNRALAGERQLVWIAGEAGIGKTTLIDRFTAETGTELIAHGQCVEQFGAGEPYLPVLEALRALCRRDPDLVSMMRQVAPTWLVQMPWLIPDMDRGTLHAELAGVGQERMVRELWELLDRYTLKQPLLLITEDLHWSDHGTLRLMDHFARRRGPLRLLWIASFRLAQVIAEEHPLQQLRQELHLHRLCEELLLDPFSETEVAEYVGARVPDADFSEDFIRKLHAHTDGLPLFVVNVLEHLLAQDAGARTDNPKVLPVPNNLAGAIEKQIAKLPAPTQAVLEAASICGMEFHAGMVAELLQMSTAAVIACCDDLVRRKYWLREAGVVELPDGVLDAQYAFRHVFYKHVFYQRVAAVQRVGFHRRVAGSMVQARAAGSPIAFAELASHHELGHEYLSAVESYIEAVKSALSHFAPEEALNLSTRAMALLPRCSEGQQRQELELTLLAHRGIASGHVLGVSSRESVESFERVRQLYDVLPQTPARALLLNGLGWGFYTRGEYANALALSQRIHAVAQRYADPVLFVYGCTLMGVTLATQGKHRPACEWLKKGIATCEQLGERLHLPVFLVDPEVSMRSNLVPPLVQLGFVDQARAQMAKALTRAERLGQPMSRMLAHWCACLMGIRLDQPGDVATHAAALDAVVTAGGLGQGRGPSLWLRGWAQARQGDARNGHARILEGYSYHERLGMHGGCTEVLGYAVEALILDARWDEAQRQLDAALQLAERIGEYVVMPELLLLQGRIVACRGDRAGSRRWMEKAVERACAQEALTCEIKALTALVERDDRSPEDLVALADAYGRLTEGFDSSANERARALLAAATVSSPPA